MLDNRKTEARELLTALAESYTALMRLREGVTTSPEVQKMIDGGGRQSDPVPGGPGLSGCDYEAARRAESLGKGDDGI